MPKVWTLYGRFVDKCIFWEIFLLASSCPHYKYIRFLKRKKYFNPTFFLPKTYRNPTFQKMVCSLIGKQCICTYKCIFASWEISPKPTDPRFHSEWRITVLWCYTFLYGEENDKQLNPGLSIILIKVLWRHLLLFPDRHWCPECPEGKCCRSR